MTCERPPEKILDKVRKLLALSAGTPYAAEAETAMAAAQRLLLEHGLSLTDVDVSDTDRSFTDEVVFAGKRAPYEAADVWLIVEAFFFCQPIAHNGRLYTERRVLCHWQMLLRGGQQRHAANLSQLERRLGVD